MWLPLKYLALATLGFFLFTAVAYACPGNLLVGNPPANVSTPMPGHDMARNNDCGDPEVNPCQSVRDQMVSVKAAPAQLTGSVHRLNEIPQPLPQAVPATIVLDGSSPPTIAAFHPVFKLQLSFSYRVLRL
jgi:hypothetical protein